MSRKRRRRRKRDGRNYLLLLLGARAPPSFAPFLRPFVLSIGFTSRAKRERERESFGNCCFIVRQQRRFRRQQIRRVSVGCMNEGERDCPERWRLSLPRFCSEEGDAVLLLLLQQQQQGLGASGSWAQSAGDESSGCYVSLSRSSNSSSSGSSIVELRPRGDLEVAPLFPVSSLPGGCFPPAE